MAGDVLSGPAPSGPPMIVAVPVPADPGARSRTAERLALVRDELIAWFKTLASAAVYATLIVTFGFQVARVDGLSMAPTLEDHDRLIVNKLVYELGDPRPEVSGHFHPKLRLTLKGHRVSRRPIDRDAISSGAGCTSCAPAPSC